MRFEKIANHCSHAVGSPWAFIAATIMVIVWAISGPSFHYSDTWELVINTTTTIITFLIVFLIQNTQNRDARALHLKLDELIYVLKKADNALIHCEHMTEAELDIIAHKYEMFRKTIQTVKDKKKKNRE